MKRPANLLTIATAAVFTVLSCSSLPMDEPGPDSPSDETKPGKELLIPEGTWRVPEGNDFRDKGSDYSFHRMVESDNVAIFWHWEYGDNPAAHPQEGKRFDVHFALQECERFYTHYVEELRFVQKGHSLTDRYKLVVFVFGGDEGTAYGGGAGDKVGMIWTNASRINRPPYGVLAHEMAHSFQYLSRLDNGGGPGGPLMEVSAQYMLWQVYPEWMTFENYHLVDFMTSTHYAFLHPRNMYNAPYVLEYWSQLHGREFFGRLFRESLEGEDAVTTYKRMHSLPQEAFNDEMFDAARRFITWDLPRVASVARPYANQHTTLLNRMDDDWYRIDSTRCPQNYGYNGIRLEVPEAGTRLELRFQGMAGAEGYAAVNTDKAGWRYGFVASIADGSRVYGDIHRESEGQAVFEVPPHTRHLWLVVSGAPTEHWPVPSRRRDATSEEQTEENWPYRFHLSGTAPDPSVVR